MELLTETYKSEISRQKKTKKALKSIDFRAFLVQNWLLFTPEKYSTHLFVVLPE
jgi:hypothetical protein